MGRASLRNRGIAFLMLFAVLMALLGAGRAHKGGSWGILLPAGLDPDAFVVPSDNPPTPEKIALGRLLYFDKRLSKDGTVACASCHSPKLAFADGQPVSTGIHQQKGGRSAPTVINRVFSSKQFWDGRASSMEDQAKGPIVNPIEMGDQTLSDVVQRLRRIPGYRALFKKAFGTERFEGDHLARAIASFERTVVSGNSAFDRDEYLGDKKALSPAAKRGLQLFRNKARCTTCHSGFNFTDEKFHNVGVGFDKPEKKQDLGLYQVTHREEDKGKFKTPTLREISRTAPYMHDGRFKTLEEVVDFYDRGGFQNPNLDKEVKPLALSPEEKKDLVQFMKSLEGEGWQHLKPPTQFPR